MLRIQCPWCGERDETEFRYRGDASRTRPDAGAGADADADAVIAAFSAYTYERANPRGWHQEWWLHVGGCRRLLRLTRDTQSHEIRTVAAATER